jgi:uncharacterized membrane protein
MARCGDAPHWCPPGFMAWPGYNPLWANLLTWLCGQRDAIQK